MTRPNIPLLLAPTLQDKADVVYGSRFMGGRPHRVLYFWHSVGNRLLTLLSNVLTDLNLTDMETCYKAFRREVIQSMNLGESRFGFEPEVTVKIAKRRLRVYEVGDQLLRPHLRGRQENRMEGRRASRLVPAEILDPRTKNQRRPCRGSRFARSRRPGTQAVHIRLAVFSIQPLRFRIAVAR